MKHKVKRKPLLYYTCEANKILHPSFLMSVPGCFNSPFRVAQRLQLAFKRGNSFTFGRANFGLNIFQSGTPEVHVWSSLIIQQDVLRRSKRRWVLSTIDLGEDDPGPFPKELSRVKLWALKPNEVNALLHREWNKSKMVHVLTLDVQRYGGRRPWVQDKWTGCGSWAGEPILHWSRHRNRLCPSFCWQGGVRTSLSCEIMLNQILMMNILYADFFSEVSE